jgi:hypothetical protein
MDNFFLVLSVTMATGLAATELSPDREAAPKIPGDNCPNPGVEGEAPTVFAFMNLLTGVEAGVEGLETVPRTFLD